MHFIFLLFPVISSTLIFITRNYYSILLPLLITSRAYQNIYRSYLMFNHEIEWDIRLHDLMHPLRDSSWYLFSEIASYISRDDCLLFAISHDRFIIGNIISYLERKIEDLTEYYFTIQYLKIRFRPLIWYLEMQWQWYDIKIWLWFKDISRESKIEHISRDITHELKRRYLLLRCNFW